MGGKQFQFLVVHFSLLFEFAVGIVDIRKDKVRFMWVKLKSRKAAKMASENCGGNYGLKEPQKKFIFSRRSRCSLMRRNRGCNAQCAKLDFSRHFGTILTPL